MKIRDKQPLLRELIADLEKKGRQAPLWRAVARNLNRPRRIWREASLRDLEAHAQAKDTILVPGRLLGSGEITKPLTVAAFTMSAAAQQKVEKAGGAVLTIRELAEKEPSGRGIRVMV